MVTGPDGLYTDHLQAAIEMVRWPRSPCSRNDGASSQAAPPGSMPCLAPGQLNAAAGRGASGGIARGRTRTRAPASWAHSGRSGHAHASNLGTSSGAISFAHASAVSASRPLTSRWTWPTVAA
jgi:hypothetical protein